MYAYFFGMSLIWWAFWVALFVAFFALLVPVPRLRRAGSTALGLLQSRYAAGEIDTAEYERRRARILADRVAHTAISGPDQNENSLNTRHRSFNIVAGGWLVVSAFLWNHTASERVNAWIVGAACVVTAITALEAPKARFVNATLAFWLAFSAFYVSHVSRATIWNNLVVALAIFFAAILPVHGRPPGTRPVTTGSA